MVYPSVALLSSGLLSVSDESEIYWEFSGNPRGKLALYLHSASELDRGKMIRIILRNALRRRTQSKNPSPDREERFPSTAKEGSEWTRGCDADESVWADPRWVL